MARAVIVASTVAQYELALEQIGLPRQQGRFAVGPTDVVAVPVSKIIVVSPCLTRSASGADRYSRTVAAVERQEARQDARAHRIAT